MNTNEQPVDSAPRRKPGRIAPWAEIITILLVAVFLAVSFFTGRVKYFVASYYVWLPIVAAVALLGMVIARLRAHLQGYVSGELEEQSAWQIPLSLCVIVLILPMVLGVVIAPTRYSSEGMRKRRVSGPARDVPLEQAVKWVMGAKAAGKAGAGGGVSLPKNPTILDVLNAAGEGNAKALEGTFVTVMGQCDLPNGAKSERFDIYRLVVTCCIADATAVAVEVARRPTVALEAGGWVRVEGIIKFDSKIDPSIPVIHATVTTKVPEPSEPYL